MTWFLAYVAEIEQFKGVNYKHYSRHIDTQNYTFYLGTQRLFQKF